MKGREFLHFSCEIFHNSVYQVNSPDWKDSEAVHSW